MPLTVLTSSEATSPFADLRASAARALALFDLDNETGEPEPIRGPIASFNGHGAYGFTETEPSWFELAADNDINPFPGFGGNAA